MQAIFVAALLLLASGGAFASETKPPRISIATVDWDTARAALNDSEAARRLSAVAPERGSPHEFGLGRKKARSASISLL